MSEERSHRFQRALRVGLSLLCVVVAGWLACWHLWLGAAWWLAVAWAASTKRPWWAWAGATAAGGALVPWCLVSYAQRADALMAAVRARGPGALGLEDLTAIVGLNLAMAASGAVLGFPEVAAETALLTFPGDAERVWSGGSFPRCAPQIQRWVGHQQQRVRKGLAPQDKRVAWSYGAPGTSFRAALALSPSQLTARREGDELVFDVTVPVDYPPHYRLVFANLGFTELIVQEGLFHAAESRGWLHPYQLTYRTHLPLDAPPLPPCEAWSVRLAEAIGG